MGAIIELSQTLGQLNKNTTLIGEEVIYTANLEGNASITGKVGTASYTISLKNSEYRPPAVLNLYMISPGEYNPSFTVDIGGTVKNIMTGDKIKKGSVKLYLNGENVKNITVDVDDGSISASLGVLNAGNYTVKAVYHDDTGEFGDCEWNSTFEIKKVVAEITVNNSAVELILGDGLNVGAVLSPSSAGNLTYSSNNPSVVSVDEYGNVTSVSAGTAIITVSLAGKNYAAADKTVNVTVKLLDANWTYIDLFTGKEEGLDGAVVGLPWNYAPTCYVRDANGTGLPAGTNITILCECDKNYTINLVVQNGGSFTVNVSDVALGEYRVTFSVGKAYKTATATIIVVKALTNITVANATVSLNIGDEVGSGATLTPADAGNLTYTVSNSSVVKVEDCKIIALAEGNATITVSFAGNDRYFAAENKTINVTVKKPDANITVSMPKKVTVGDDVAVNVRLPNNATGNVTVSVDGTNVKTVSLTNSTANFTLSDLAAGSHSIKVIYSGDDRYASGVKETSLTVNKVASKLTAKKVTATYNVKKNLVVALKDAKGNALSGVKVTVKIKGSKTYTTDKNGQVKVNVAKLVPKKYTAKISFAGNAKYKASSVNAKVTVNKAKPKMTAKKKTFKSSKKVKKYTITLKDYKGKPIKKAKLTLKVKGKTYKAKTNNKGKATFKIKNLKEKGTYKATITYKGNKYYKKLTKKVKIKVKSVFKTISKGSKNTKMVKKIQRALKDNGYYTTYKGSYLKVDGKYTGITVKEVKRYQKAHGLKVTGKVDEKTAKKLKVI